MIKLEFYLITGRSIEQGCGKEKGKFSEEYINNVAVCEMNAEDMKKLNIREGENIKVTTKFGSVILKAKKSRRIRSSGMIFIPYGAWANVVLGSDTEGTGMPTLKGLKVIVESTDEKVLGLPDLIIQVYGKEKL
jgi:formylmethanofuran dehydrogenase subunit D